MKIQVNCKKQQLKTEISHNLEVSLVRLLYNILTLNILNITLTMNEINSIQYVLSVADNSRRPNDRCTFSTDKPSGIINNS